MTPGAEPSANLALVGDVDGADELERRFRARLRRHAAYQRLFGDPANAAAAAVVLDDLRGASGQDGRLDARRPDNSICPYALAWAEGRRSLFLLIEAPQAAHASRGRP